jgi:hypothetical protein
LLMKIQISWDYDLCWLQNDWKHFEWSSCRLFQVRQSTSFELIHLTYGGINVFRNVGSRLPLDTSQHSKKLKWFFTLISEDFFSAGETSIPNLFYGFRIKPTVVFVQYSSVTLFQAISSSSFFIWLHFTRTVLLSTHIDGNAKEVNFYSLWNKRNHRVVKAPVSRTSLNGKLRTVLTLPFCFTDTV